MDLSERLKPLFPLYQEIVRILAQLQVYVQLADVVWVIAEGTSAGPDAICRTANRRFTANALHNRSCHGALRLYQRSLTTSRSRLLLPRTFASLGLDLYPLVDLNRLLLVQSALPPADYLLDSI